MYKINQIKTDPRRKLNKSKIRSGKTKPNLVWGLTCGKNDKLFVLSAYRLTARSSSMVMWCDPECEDRVESDDEQLDWFDTEKMPGPSNETDNRAQDSSSDCSGMMPREIALLPTVVPPAVSNAGVD